MFLHGLAGQGLAMLVHRKMKHVGLGAGFLTNASCREGSALVSVPGIAASWAFKKNESRKRIAALALYGTLVLGRFVPLQMPWISDNQGKVYSPQQRQL